MNIRRSCVIGTLLLKHIYTHFLKENDNERSKHLTQRRTAADGGHVDE